MELVVSFHPKNIGNFKSNLNLYLNKVQHNIMKEIIWFLTFNGRIKFNHSGEAYQRKGDWKQLWRFQKGAQIIGKWQL